MAHFVGRERELSAFGDLLSTGDAPRIVFLHGPGGGGKSLLLEAFRDTARRLDVGFARLDARLLPAAPSPVAAATQQALATLKPSPNHHDLRVLALDHAEQLAAMDGWLREELIPGLPRGTVLVLASRRRPGPEWRADPGLNELLADYELGALDTGAVSLYLRLRGVPPAQQAAVGDFARGHPLTLALAADHALREPGGMFDHTASPDLIHDLIEWLLRGLDDPLRLRALAACATVRTLSEPLLAVMLDREDVGEQFDWLAGLHFVEQQPAGVVVHDAVRELIVRDLRDRDLARHHEMIRRATAHTFAGLETVDEPRALRALWDVIYTIRHEPYGRREFPLGELHCYPDKASPEELPALADEVERLEGAESARWFKHWVQAGAELVVMRDDTRKPVALTVLVTFCATDVPRGSQDPAVAALFRHLRHHAPLRGAEQVLLGRFIFAHGTHQARTSVWAELVGQLNGIVFRPGVDVMAWVADLSRDWTQIGEYSDCWMLPESEYSIDGRQYSLFGHDYRREPPLQWAYNSVERILRDGQAPELLPSQPALLDESEFRDAVLQALHDFNDETLAHSSLLESPMLRRYTSRPDPETLRALIRKTSATKLAGRQHRSTPHGVLEQTYFLQSSSKQQAIAVGLNMSERTLRRRLREAEDQLVDALWKLDTRGG